MRCETARRMMMDRLYEDLPPDKCKTLDKHMKTCATCSQEWEDVRQAHVFMESMPDSAVPIHLQQAVLQQSQLEALPPERESFSRNWPKWAAAAAFFIIVGVSYSIWETDRPNHTNDAALVNPGIHEAIKKLNGTLNGNENESAREEHANAEKLTEPQSSRTETVSAPALETKRPSVEHTVIAPDDPANRGAEELFRTGLRLYNNAFTKVDGERETLLKSAVLMLNDLETRYPGAAKWTAMGMILKADSYRSLGERDKAIETYSQMTERFFDMPTYSQQARASIIKLLLEGEDRLHETEIQLVQYESTIPPPVEYASLALAFSDKVKSSSPVQALNWCQRVRDVLPKQHPIREKANHEFRVIQEELKDGYYIQDWKIVGPFLSEALPQFDSLNPEYDAFSDLIRNAKNPEAVKLIQRKSNGDPVVDIVKLLNKPPVDTSVFAQTYVYCPNDRWINIRTGYTDGMRVWLNGDPIFSNFRQQSYHKDMYGVGAQFKKGWNQLFVKCHRTRNVREWKFSMLPTDGKGNFMLDLKYDSLYRQTADSK